MNNDPANSYYLINYNVIIYKKKKETGSGHDPPKKKIGSIVEWDCLRGTVQGISRIFSGLFLASHRYYREFLHSLLAGSASPVEKFGTQWSIFGNIFLRGLFGRVCSRRDVLCCEEGGVNMKRPKSERGEKQVQRPAWFLWIVSSGTFIIFRFFFTSTIVDVFEPKYTRRAEFWLSGLRITACAL